MMQFHMVVAPVNFYMAAAQPCNPAARSAALAGGLTIPGTRDRETKRISGLELGCLQVAPGILVLLAKTCVVEPGWLSRYLMPHL